MAKTKEVTEEFSIGKNTYKVGEVLSFSDELAKEYESKLKNPEVKKTTKVIKKVAE
jgi:hypothetical protein